MVNERNLSRRLSTDVVEALKAHGHILVVRGGTAALVRELEELMAPRLAILEPDGLGEQAIEEICAGLTRALMSSDHVEDVFAEDGVIRRDMVRTIREGLKKPAIEVSDDIFAVTVKLDALGYVAATASKRADVATLRQALDRAASVAHARFSGFVPEAREATFRVEGAGSDARLELEEAVADELTDLVEQGVVVLPTVVRQLDLGRAISAADQRGLVGRIDAAAEETLLRSGCTTAWDFADVRTLRVTFTPLSDQDARGVDGPTLAFAQELVEVFGLEELPVLMPAEPAPLPAADTEDKEPVSEPTLPAAKPKRVSKRRAPAEPSTEVGVEDAPAPAPKRRRAVSTAEKSPASRKADATQPPSKRASKTSAKKS